MKLLRFAAIFFYGGFAFSLGMLPIQHAHATAHAVVVPSTWTNSIQVQGELAGTEFDDWTAAGIPIATTDALDNPGASLIDINTVQIANDANFVYLRVTYYTTDSSGTFLAFDTDQDAATGFDVLALGPAAGLGSDLGYSNDFAFEQEPAPDFNTGDPLTGGPLGNGGALIFPFFNIDGVEKEYAIPLDTMFSNPAEAAFPGTTFDLMVYTDEGLGDVTDVLTYTLATNPGQSGDFDSDLDVDGADFLEWQRNFGGTLGASDLVDWETNYGTPAPLSALSSSSSVPEPSSLVLACFAMAGLGLRRRNAV